MVVSAARRPDKNPVLAAWLKKLEPDQLYISAITIAELERGVVLAERADPSYGALLRSWIAKLPAAFAGRVLAVDEAVAVRWGQLAGQIGHIELDLGIAATAIEHGLAVVTRNASHFAPTGVRILDPWRPSR
jgi:predicted nucleic acid-binding protein